MKEVCNCGKSPTGFCDGWHDLTDKEYFEKLKEYRELQKKNAGVAQG